MSWRAWGLIGSCVTLAACIGNIGGSGEDGLTTPASGTESGAFAPPAMRRLTQDQYANAVAQVFGETVAFSSELEQDETSEAFLSMGASRVGTSERGVEQYQAAAIEIAAQVVDGAAEQPVLADCAPFVPGDACIEEAIAHYGRLLFRRPMTELELSQVVAVTDAVDMPTADTQRLGMIYALAALLTSPSFIYVPEVGREVPGGRAVTGYEMASRLSLMLWNALPDDALLDAAAAGELDNPEGVRKQAERMLDMPAAEDLATRFFGEAWHVAGLDANDKSTEMFPEWTPELVASYKTEFDLFLRDLTVERDGDIRELFTGRTSFIDGALGELYGMTIDTGDHEATPLPDERAGLLTTPAVIAAISPTDRTSPTHRGVFILEDILCNEVPPPPPSVDDVIPPDDPEGEPKTLREKLAQHREDPVCAACHDLFDPMGFAFESFDAIGRFRTEDVNGAPIDDSAAFGGEDFSGVSPLADKVADDPRMTQCLTERLYAFAAGHAPKDGEEAVVETLTDELRGHLRFRALVLDIVTSDAFRYLGPEAETN